MRIPFNVLNLIFRFQGSKETKYYHTNYPTWKACSNTTYVRPLQRNGERFVPKEFIDDHFSQFQKPVDLMSEFVLRYSNEFPETFIVEVNTVTGAMLRAAALQGKKALRYVTPTFRDQTWVLQRLTQELHSIIWKYFVNFDARGGEEEEGGERE